MFNLSNLKKKKKKKKDTYLKKQNKKQQPKKKENKWKDKKMFFWKCEEMFSIKMLYENKSCLLSSVSSTGHF